MCYYVIIFQKSSATEAWTCVYTWETVKLTSAAWQEVRISLFSTVNIVLSLNSARIYFIPDMLFLDTFAILLSDMSAVKTLSQSILGNQFRKPKRYYKWLLYVRMVLYTAFNNCSVVSRRILGKLPLVLIQSFWH